MLVPIFKGEKTDSREYVEGYLKEKYSNRLVSKRVFVIVEPKYLTEYKIDIETLSISFDNGKTWRNIETVADMLLKVDAFFEDKGAKDEKFRV